MRAWKVESPKPGTRGELDELSKAMEALKKEIVDVVQRTNEGLAKRVDASGQLRDQLGGTALTIRFDGMHRTAEAFDATRRIAAAGKAHLGAELRGEVRALHRRIGHPEPGQVGDREIDEELG